MMVTSSSSYVARRSFRWVRQAARHTLPTRSIRGCLFSASRMGVDDRVTQTLPPVPSQAHRIVLCRHGESEFNNANVFTGW